MRYHHRAAPVSISVSGDAAEVRFDEPQLAVAPGQGAAFYDGERLLGGGWIASSRPVEIDAGARAPAERVAQS